MIFLPRFHHWPLLRRGILLLSIVIGVCLGTITAAVVSPDVRFFAIRTILSFRGVDLPHDADGYTNILLLGVGDVHHDGADLTDAMIVASIDPHTHSVVLLSLPRDLLIDTKGHEVEGRINAIYANEKRRLEYREKMPTEQAALQALDTVSKQIGDKMGIQIHGVLKADFTAFTETVDALGGVDIDVPDSIIDYTYPLAENQVGVFQVEKGLQHFDGEIALKYARSRHSTSDFDRSARQQLILSALGTNVKSLSIMQRVRLLPNLYKRLQAHVVSTFSPGQLILLAQMGSTIQRDRVMMMQLNFYTGGDTSEASPGGFVYPAPPELYEGASVLLPTSLFGQEPNWNQIRTFTAFLVRYRSLSFQHPVVDIRSAGVQSIQAWRLRNEFLRYGFTALPLAKKPSASGSTIYSAVYYKEEKFQPAASFTAQLLKLPVARLLDDTGSGDVILLLGLDFKFQPFVTLSGAVLPIQ